jgi:hypothetical protein
MDEREDVDGQNALVMLFSSGKDFSDEIFSAERKARLPRSPRQRKELPWSRNPSIVVR